MSGVAVPNCVSVPKCTQVPRQQCSVVNRDVPDTVCVQVPKTECVTVTKQVPETVCTPKPVTTCAAVPYPVTVQVPVERCDLLRPCYTHRTRGWEHLSHVMQVWSSGYDVSLAR